MPVYVLVFLNMVVVCKIESELSFLAGMTFPSNGYGGGKVTKEVYDSYNVGDTLQTKAVKHGT